MYDKKYYLNALSNREKAPRLYQMVRELRINLDDESIPFAELVADASTAGDVLPKTVKSWLYGAAKHGLIRIHGEYVRRAGEAPEDTRMVSLGDWPLPEGIRL